MIDGVLLFLLGAAVGACAGYGLASAQWRTAIMQMKKAAPPPAPSPLDMGDLETRLETLCRQAFGDEWWKNAVANAAATLTKTTTTTTTTKTLLTTCTTCGQQNRVNFERRVGARCGACGLPLNVRLS